MERYEEAERRAKEAEAAAQGRKTLALAGAVLIGLIPLGSIGRRIIQEKSWKENPSGTARPSAPVLPAAVRWNPSQGAD